jgi:hypothetical protein
MGRRPQLKDIKDLDVLRLAQGWEAGGPGVGEALVDAGVPPKLAYAKIIKLVHSDLLEYGVSATYAWLTEKGRKLLTDASAA